MSDKHVILILNLDEIMFMQSTLHKLVTFNQKLRISLSQTNDETRAKELIQKFNEQINNTWFNK